jgi:hypothetical protein
MSIHLKFRGDVNQSLQSDSAEGSSGVTSSEVVSGLPVSLQSEQIETSLQRSSLEVVLKINLDLSDIFFSELDGGFVDGVNLVSTLSSLNDEAREAVPGAVKGFEEGLDVGVVGGVLVEFLSAVNERGNVDFSVNKVFSSVVNVESVSVTFNEEGGVVEETVDTGGVGVEGSNVDGLDGFLSDGVDFFVVLSEDDVGDLAELLASLEVVLVVESLDHDGEVGEDLFVVLNEVSEVEFSVGQQHVEFSSDDAVSFTERLSADFEDGEGVDDELNLFIFSSWFALKVVVLTESSESGDTFLSEVSDWDARGLGESRDEVIYALNVKRSREGENGEGQNYE